MDFREELHSSSRNHSTRKDTRHWKWDTRLYGYQLGMMAFPRNTLNPMIPGALMYRSQHRSRPNPKNLPGVRGAASVAGDGLGCWQWNLVWAGTKTRMCSVTWQWWLLLMDMVKIPLDVRAKAGTYCDLEKQAVRASWDKLERLLTGIWWFQKCN